MVALVKNSDHWKLMLVYIEPSSQRLLLVFNVQDCTSLDAFPSYKASRSVLSPSHARGFQKTSILFNIHRIICSLLCTSLFIDEQLWS